jgi:hypothetical protein
MSNEDRGMTKEEYIKRFVKHLVDLGFDQELAEIEADAYWEYAWDDVDHTPESDASESADNLRGMVIRNESREGTMSANHWRGCGRR